MKQPARVPLRTLGIAFVVAVAAFVAGCGGGSGSSAGDGEANAAAAQPGGTLRFGLESEPTTLNPFNAIELTTTYVIPQINETLFNIDSKGKPQPNLATEYTTSADGLTWTFQIRKGVKFSDGTPMTADDVAFSIEKARVGPYFASLYEPIERARATSPSTVVVETSKPMPAMLADLALYVAGIVPENFGGVSEKEFAEHPVGTGPFEFKSWKHGQAITLVKNASYWQPDLPLLDEIVYTFTTDENARLAQLRGGDIDMTRATPLTVKSGLAQAPDVRVEEIPGVWTYFMLLNQNDQLFEDPRVRRAVNLAVNREGMIQAGADGKATLGAAFLPPSVEYSAEDLQPPPQDIAKAKSLLAEAVDEGASTDFTIKFFSFDSFARLASQIAQQDLEEVGFDVKLQAVDEAAINAQLEAGEYEAVLASFLPYVTDPSELTSFYLAFYAQNSGADVEGQTKLSDEANVEQDPSKREQLYHQLQEEIAAEESLQILYYLPMVTVVRDEVTGLEFNPVGLVALGAAGFSD